ncbi:spermine oxidase-like isoform X2 [Condylostylus longicornis]|uniref:spermine oxidase-like isoform X2 n=1 Tax=Condylostylus longicornis TaxID=2530218 RepID=UPI00244DE355|nr:spermine oxidase-like isoform X2 [Condylostylus longicornis]
MLDIVIIGAGASGIAAATKLVENGIDVKILEAEDRIGGRINTIPFGKGVVDLGAQWCHGEKNNVVYEICSKYPNIFGSTGDVYASFILIRSNKEIIPKDITSRLTALVSDILEAAKYDLNDSTDSFGAYLNHEFNKHLNKPEYSDISKKVAHEFFEFYKKFECSVDAADYLEDISGKGYNDYWECKGDPVLNWKDKGYVSFLQILMKSKKEKKLGTLTGKILFKKKVQNICWSRNKGEKIKIVCSDSEEILADHVICTVSLGVLKRENEIFQPKLPKEKLNAIEGLGFGTVNKIYLEFPKSFWPLNWPGFSILWDVDELENIRKRNDSWIEDLFGFYTDYQENVLCGWISGEKARSMENYSDKEIEESCMFLLKKFLSWEIPEIVSIKRSNWFSNSNFRGSYSFRSVAAERLEACPRDLAKPILSEDGVPILLFAGEATHDHYFSTVHGAVESGWREASRLIKHFSEDNFSDVLILGCGLAGLGAAYALQNFNLKVRILEAQNYIGGRILTTNLKTLNNKATSERIDVGAQWLHDEQNLLFNIGKKYNLIEPEKSGEGLGDFFEENGNVIDKAFVEKINTVVKEILEECEKFANATEYPKSIEDYLHENFFKMLDNEIKNDTEKSEQARKLLNWHRNFQIIDNSSNDLKTVSAKAWGLYSLSGEGCQIHINIKHGFSTLVKALLQEIRPFLNIQLNKIVKKVIWKYKYNNEDLIRVETSENEVFYAKNVIITFSIGVLKEELKLFEPELPSDYRNAINNIGFETMNKIYIQFAENWWGERKGIQFIWNDINIGNTTKLHWTKYITGFDVLYPGPKNTLVGWIGSYGAKEMESLKDEEIITTCVKILEHFTKKKVPQPISYYCTRWGTNPFVKGGYSFISTKYDENEKSRECLKNPINIGNSCTVVFAGEACHSNYYSTAHGAFLSV